MQKIFKRVWTTQVVTDSEQNFAKGLNVTADISQLQEGEVRKAQNCRLTVYGALKKRLGTKRTHVAALDAHSVQGGFSWSNVSPVQELAVCNGKLFTGQFAIPMTWT